MAIVKDLAQDSTLISDWDAEGAAEQPIIVENYKGGGVLKIVGTDGESVNIPYRLIPALIKVMKKYSA